MNRFLLLRRCSMSSIEEEDESVASDEQDRSSLAPCARVLDSQHVNTSLLTSSSSSLTQIVEQLPSIPDWDSEISESEQEFEDNNEKLTADDEEQAANRALRAFIQSGSRSHQVSTKTNNDCYSPYSVHLYDDQSSSLDLILSELQEIRSEFDGCSLMDKSSNNGRSSTSEECVHELRTLEDQLEAALASLTSTINETIGINVNIEEHRSSDSSASSSGVGEEISNDSFHFSNSTTSHQFSSKFSKTLDDADSAFSDTGSAEKILLSTNLDESLFYRPIPTAETGRTELTSSLIDDPQSIRCSTQIPSKILIRTYNDDGSTKSIFIDDSMFIRDVIFVLIQKNHREVHVDYCLVEVLPDLQMERIFEDHQKLSEAILMWPTVSSNRLNFTRRNEKYSLLKNFSGENDFLYESADIEGTIYFKEKSRKSWKKHFCVLRSSGLYFVPKGKNKKDLVCLAKFENVELFFGIDWKKKFKSPTDFCFALKHPLIQKKSSKYIKYMCVESKAELDRWIVNIRLRKFGEQLKMNYLLMKRAMNFYQFSGRFVSNFNHQIEEETSRKQEIRIEQSFPQQEIDVAEQNDERSEIKSASYMDELRQRLEKVLNDQPPPNFGKPNDEKTRENFFETKKTERNFSSNFNSMKIYNGIGSTPLPRKQINVANLSYRTINQPIRNQNQQMSKSFTVAPKRQENRSESCLSINSTSESLNLDENDLKLPSTVLHQSTTNIIKTKSNLNNSNRPKSNSNPKKICSTTTNEKSRSVSNRFPNCSIPSSSSCTSRIAPIASAKPLPLVPPRKSSINNATTQRDATKNNSSSRRTHVSHL